VEVIKSAHEGIQFLSRKGTSDEKTFKEVIVKNTYEKKYFQIKKGEHWIDLGGNVGAFALKALSKGATVDIYEPDPFNCKMIEKNLKINNFNANIHQVAVVANNQKTMTMYVGNNMQVWRNSLYKNWGNQKFKIDCIHHSEVIKANSNMKMDIEGAEMPILEGLSDYPTRMVFEWSFDIDPCLERYRRIVKGLHQIYGKVHAPSYSDDYVIWPASWFPPCANVYCYDKF
jgi:FkbM family methyltransferase